MWLKYQKVSSKMSSFDPREFVKHKDEEIIKYPLKRFEPTLRTSLKVVIPMNLDRLKKHKVNVEKYIQGKKWRELNIEQINASRTVQQLQATIRDLDKIRHQIQEKDVDQFDKQIAGMKVEALNAVQEFCSVQISCHTSLPEDKLHHGNMDKNIAYSGCSKEMDNEVRQRKSSKSSQESVYNTAGSSMQDDMTVGTPNSDAATVQAMHDEEELAAYQSWDNLKSGLIDLDSLVKDFATCVHQQQEMIDNIEDNIESTHHNVNAAANLLGQASKYKAAMVPVAGAIVGGLIAGPIGLLAGFKLAGAAAAVGGGIAGYQGGKYLKKKHDRNVELELSHLSRCEKNT